MHAITLTYSLSYAAAVSLGVGKSGTGTVDAAPVLAHLSAAERSWLAQHPKATFSLDDVVTSAAAADLDLVAVGGGLPGALDDPMRLGRAVAREVRAAAAADDPARLRAAVVAQLVDKLDAARAGESVSVYVSLPRRVSDGASHLSGGIDVLTDEDVGPGVLRTLDRYLERCVAGLRRPHVAGLSMHERGSAGLLRAAYADGVAQYEDRVVRLALEAAKAGPLPCWTSDSRWARRRLVEGALGVEVVEDKKAPEGRAFRVCEYSSVIRDKRLAGAIEASLRAIELLEAVARERKGAREACDTLIAAITEAAICSALDPEQVSRRALGALPDGELAQALVDDLVARIERALGDDYAVGPLDGDEAGVRWGELPRGGSDVARALDQLACVEEWGDVSASTPVIAVRAVAVDGTEHLLEVTPVA
jgi:hypothetical protein